MPEPVPTGDPFVLALSPASTSRAGTQMTRLEDGRVVVAWTHFRGNSSDTIVEFRIFNADGSAASPIRLASGSIGQSEDPRIAALADGGFVVAWTHYGATTNVAYRVFNADGTARTPPTIVDLPGPQSLDTVAATADGGFVLGWSDATTFDALARRFDADGVAQGTAPVRISDEPGTDIGIVLVPSGTGLAAVWSDFTPGGAAGTGGIFLREMAGFPTEDQTAIGTAVSDIELSAFGGRPDIATNGDALAVIWQNSQAGSDEVDLYISVNGGAPARVNATTAGYDGEAQVTAIDGGFMVVWRSLPGNGTSVATARLYDLAGNPTSDAFPVGGAATNPAGLDVVALLDGRFLVTFDSSSTGILGHVFDPRTAAVAWTGLGADEQFVGTVFAGGDTLNGAGGADRIWGAGGPDALTGGAGNDTLAGGDGNDRLDGGTGRDRMDGGLGRDVLTGGAAQDVFVFATLPAAGTADRIVDFNRLADDFHLARAAFAALGPRVTADEFHLGLRAADANDHLVYDRATGRLWYDANGNAAGGLTLLAVLENTAALSHADFVMV